MFGEPEANEDEAAKPAANPTSKKSRVVRVSPKKKNGGRNGN
jgi:hypothetical protein